jgi:Ca2+-binding EF-hand superfamily protein
MKKILIATLVAMTTAGFLSSGAYAQDAALVFDALDTDDNGTVSQDEASVNEFVSQGFAAADSNGDGALSREEFLAAFGGN